MRSAGSWSLPRRMAPRFSPADAFFSRVPRFAGATHRGYDASRWNCVEQRDFAFARYAQKRSGWQFRCRACRSPFAAYSGVLLARSDSFQRTEQLRLPCIQIMFAVIIAANHDTGLNNFKTNR